MKLITSISNQLSNHGLMNYSRSIHWIQEDLWYPVDENTRRHIVCLMIVPRISKLKIIDESKFATISNVVETEISLFHRTKRQRGVKKNKKNIFQDCWT